ncbi:MAG: hypothetical protein IH599_09620, partial [Bacteroidales bacterium]|nr:hypothetical protein [Bacteroidales bacterium]
ISCSGNSTRQSQGSGDIVVTADSAIDIQTVRVEWSAPGHERVLVFAEGKATRAELPSTNSDAFDVYLGLISLGGGGVDRAVPGNRNSFHFHIGTKGKNHNLDLRVSGPDSANNFFLKRYVRDMQGNISRTEYYDQHGRKAWETYDKLSRDGELEARNRIEYAYDDKGLKISQVHIATTPDGTVKNRIENTYAYEESGREKLQVSSTFDGSGQLKNRTENHFTYYSSGLMKEKVFIAYGADGVKSTHYITEYFYDDRDLLITEILYTGERVRINMVEKRYNEVTTVVAESITEYFPDGSVKSRHGREYDDKGKVLKEF